MKCWSNFLITLCEHFASKKNILRKNVTSEILTQFGLMLFDKAVLHVVSADLLFGKLDPVLQVNKSFLCDLHTGCSRRDQIGSDATWLCQSDCDFGQTRHFVPQGLF